MRYLWIALVVVLVPGGLLLLAIAVVKRLRTVNEPAIPPLSAKHYRFTKHDEGLALRTLAKRAEADEMKRRARQIETQGERPQRLRRVH